jgi:hypothetical protein
VGREVTLTAAAAADRSRAAARASPAIPATVLRRTQRHRGVAIGLTSGATRRVVPILARRVVAQRTRAAAPRVPATRQTEVETRYESLNHRRDSLKHGKHR